MSKVDRPFRSDCVTDLDGVLSVAPSGWRPRVYRLRSGAFRLTRKSLQVHPSLSIEELRLHAGAIRIGGPFDAGVLRIGFIQAEEVRILGNLVNNDAVALARGGGRLDVSANVPGVALAVSFGPDLAPRVAPEETLARLSFREPLGALYPLTLRGRALKEMLQGRLADAASEKGGADALEGRIDDLLRASAALVEEIVAARLVIPNASAGRRHELALAVEALLWESPEPSGSRRALSLDVAARRLQCSRRSIQLALYEEFGIGFVALKRVIRLQQVHAILRRSPESSARIGHIAKTHEFNHPSRFAKYYRDMFGVVPSLDFTAGGDVPE